MKKKKYLQKMLLSIYKEHIYSQKTPQTKPIVSIENVVVSALVDQKIDLNVITQTFADQCIIYIPLEEKELMTYES